MTAQLCFCWRNSIIIFSTVKTPYGTDFSFAVIKIYNLQNIYNPKDARYNIYVGYIITYLQLKK